jgi:hypothetical protein
VKVAVGTIIGFMSSTIAKVFIQLGMIGWFTIEVIGLGFASHKGLTLPRIDNLQGRRLINSKVEHLNV